jgi:hypothetical protein
LRRFHQPGELATLRQLGVAEEIPSSTSERLINFGSLHLGVDAEVRRRENGAAFFGVSMRRLALDALLLSHAKREGLSHWKNPGESLQRFNNT